jgi:hypothetical protein
MKKRLITIACTIALVLGLAPSALAAQIPSQAKIDFTTFKEGAVETITLPAYATGAGGAVKWNKTIIQELSYKKIDSGDCYTYVITREQKVSKSDIVTLGTKGTIGCQYGSFDIYSGDTIGFGTNPNYDVISAEESGVGVPVYLADVVVDGKVYTLSSYQLKTTPFTKEDDGYYHSTTVEVVNIPKDYDGFAIVTYGLTKSEEKKAKEFDKDNQKNGTSTNIYTQLSTFIDPDHVAYYRFE